MDKRAAEICAKAFDILDAVDEQRAIWAAEQEALTPFEKMDRENAEADQYLADLKRRRLEQEPLVYRTAITPPEPKASAMTDAADRAWVMRQLDAVTKLIAEEVDRREIELRLAIRAKREMLEAKIEKLQQEVADLKAAKPDVSTGSVTSLRGRSVNAA